MPAIDAFQVVRDFEAALCEYTGATYAVTTTSCTQALLMACAYFDGYGRLVTIPKRTYVGVAASIINAGYYVDFRKEEWSGEYELRPLPVWDCARRFTSAMYRAGLMQCVSFHTSKILGDTQGGAILHDNPEADAWLRRARFDGRTEGNPNAPIQYPSWHAYMSTDVAARLLWKLSWLPRHNPDLPNSDYPDLSLIEAFE